MDMKQLEAFLYTVKCQSFSLAARKLYLSQPTISAHVQSLEEELGTELLIRSTKKLEVTEAGQKLYEYAENIINMKNRALRELSSDGRGELHIGVSSVPAQSVLPKLLQCYYHDVPKALLRIVADDSIHILDMVSDHMLDVGFVGTMEGHRECEFVPVGTDELVVVTPNLPFFCHLKERNADIRELLKQPMLMREDSSGTQKTTERLLGALGIRMDSLSVAAYIAQPELIKSCIMQNMGISILSKYSIREEEAREQLLVFPIDHELSKRTLYMVYRKKNKYTGEAADFIAFVKNAAAAEKAE